MEPENPSTEKYGDRQIGEDKPQVEAKICVVEDYKVEEITIKDKKTSNDRVARKVKLLVRHPDIHDKQIEISGAKYESGEKIKVSGLWWQEDSEGKIPFNSVLAHVLRKYKKPTLKELKGEQIETVNDDQNYLVVKAY